METQEATISKKQSNASLATGIYLNYAILSIAQIIISQYSSSFQVQWNTDLKGISTVISMMGIGRLLTILFAGVFSDKYGRKPILIVGMVSNSIFFAGLVFSNSLIAASIFSLFLGFANSFDDSAAYPALSEAFPAKSASMNSLVKAAMSVAQFVLPFIVAAISNAKVTVVILAIVIIANIVLVISSKFPKTNAVSQEQPKKKAENLDTTTLSGNKPSMKIDGLLLICLGFTISFTFYVYTQYIPNYGTTVLGLDPNVAKSLISWYAIFSLISVFLTTVIVTKVKPIILVIVYPLISLIFLFALSAFPSAGLARITSAVIGFFAAGGVWQLGLAVLTKYFPGEKGRMTGYYSFAAALTYFVGPFASSFIIGSTPASVLTVFWLDVAVTLIGVLAALTVFVRAKKYKFDI